MVAKEGLDRLRQLADPGGTSVDADVHAAHSPRTLLGYTTCHDNHAGLVTPHSNRDGGTPYPAYVPLGRSAPIAHRGRGRSWRWVQARCACAQGQYIVHSKQAPPAPPSLHHRPSPAAQAELRGIYDRLARGGKLLSRDDLQAGLRQAMPGAHLTDEQLERMFRAADLDSDGRSSMVKGVKGAFARCDTWLSQPTRGNNSPPRVVGC